MRSMQKYIYTGYVEHQESDRMVTALAIHSALLRHTSRAACVMMEKSMPKTGHLSAIAQMSSC